MDTAIGTIPDAPTVDVGYRSRDRMLVMSLPAIPQGGQVELELLPFLRKSGVPKEDLLRALDDAPATRITTSEAPEFQKLRLEAMERIDFEGRTVIDVGGYDGEFAAVAKQRGAARVRLIDNGQWQSYRWRAPEVPEGVTYIGCDILEWQEPADILIFGNVLYHMHDPWRALWHLRTLCRERIVLWTSFIDCAEPVFHLAAPEKPFDVVHDDYFTVFWKPSVSGLLRLLDRTGWKDIEEVGRAGDHVVLVAR